MMMMMMMNHKRTQICERNKYVNKCDTSDDDDDNETESGDDDENCYDRAVFDHRNSEKKTKKRKSNDMSSALKYVDQDEMDDGDNLT